MGGSLEADRRSYNELKELALAALEAGEDERCLDLCRAAAALASRVHIGIWYDTGLEEILRSVGRRVAGTRARVSAAVGATAGSPPGAPTADGRKRVAHITSFLSDMGGHSRTIRQMVLLLEELGVRQTIFVTNLSSEPVPHPHFERGLSGRAVDIIELLPDETYYSRVGALQEHIEQEGYELAILFVSGDDVIAFSALAGLEKRPPTLYFNHNDMDFWLGKMVTDRLIDARTVGARYSRVHRGIESSFILPVTSDFRKGPRNRGAIGIPEDATLSVSLGSFYKTMGDPGLDYFRAVGRVLERFPNHYHMFLTGPPPPDIDKRVAALPFRPEVKRRLIVYGPEPEPLKVYSSADFLIETFPCVGGMVRVEAMAVGLPILGFKNKRFPLLSETDNFPPDYPLIASSGSEVEELSSRLIQDPMLRERVGRQLREYFEKKFAPEVLLPGLRAFLDALLAREEQPESAVSSPSGSPDARLQDGSEAAYDVEYAHDWRYRDLWPWRFLLLQAVTKRGDFSLRDRARFYSMALKKGEFAGALDRAAYLGIALGGRLGFLALSRFRSALT
ncbi:MAG: hypothetical protein QW379_05620 [Thermoplasmata archaeon]